MAAHLVLLRGGPAPAVAAPLDCEGLVAMVVAQAAQEAAPVELVERVASPHRRASAASARRVATMSRQIPASLPALAAVEAALPG
ncbi:hypothetical protein ASE00_16365 [Sphingomonas sp. Root710]|nr:hypothetical protein ASE00_16365 [Sphingomonas sp. Root710]